MTTSELLLSGWDLHPTVIIGCALVVAGYLVMTGFRLSRATLAFVAGVAVLLVALISPIDMLGDTYLFSAHMLQHLLLLLVVPPLLLLGLPKWFLKEVLKWPGMARLEHILRQPLVAWFLMTGVVWGWHIPFLYDLTVQNLTVHVGEHLMFLVVSTIFWWPVLSPIPERRYPPLIAILYLLAGALANALLGIILTFVPAGLYTAYVNPADSPGILPLIRGEWGLSLSADQQLGGILMWAPASLIYLTAIMYTMVRWYSLPETDTPPVRVRAGQTQ